MLLLELWWSAIDLSAYEIPIVVWMQALPGRGDMEKAYL